MNSNYSGKTLPAGKVGFAPFFFVALCATVFSVFPHRAASAAEPVDSVAVVVGNKALTRLEIELNVAQAAQEREFLRQQPLPADKLKKQVLQRLVDDLLVENMADEQGITVGDQEVRDRVEGFKKQNKLNETAFEETIKNMNFTVRQFNQAQIRNIKRQKAIRRAVSSKIQIRESEVRALYEAENSKKLYRVRHLLRQTPQGAGEEQTEKAEQEIVFLLAELEKGEDFETLILDYSEDPSAKENKGVLEFQLGNAIEAMEAVLVKMKPGEIYPDPVKTRFGYHVLELMEIREEPKKPYAEVKQAYNNRLYQEKFNRELLEFFAELRKRTPIRFADESLKSFYSGNS